MRFIGRAAVLSVATLFAAGPVLAQEHGDQTLNTVPVNDTSSGTDTGAPPVESEMSTTYSSIGLQKMHVKADGVDVKDPVNLDFTMIGFRIPPAPWFAVELNLGFTMIPGQVNASGSGGACDIVCQLSGGTATGGGQSQADLSMTTAGVFAVLRSTGSVFAMGKVGYRYLNSSIEGFPEQRSGNAYGGGIGYRWNKKGSYAELGYTHYNSEISAIGFSISYSYDRR